MLTLPPTLPTYLEEALKPYFTFTENQQQSDFDKMQNTLFYKNLFEFEDNASPDRKSIESSPALSTGTFFNEFTRDLSLCETYKYLLFHTTRKI